MKKIFLIGMIAVLALSVTACSLRGGKPQSEPESSEEEISLPEPDPATPEGAMSEVLVSIKDWDVATVETYLPDGVTVAKYVPAAFEDSVVHVLSRMSYTVGETALTGDTATVELNITAVDMSSAMGDATGAALAYVAKQKIAGKPVDDINAITQVVIDAIDIDKLPTKSFPATAYMVMGGDGEWKLDLSSDANLPLINAVSGGSVDLVSEMKTMAATYGVNIGG